jgi:hypothetical protein
MRIWILIKKFLDLDLRELTMDPRYTIEPSKC